MATSSKFDLSSGSPDRPVYNSGQRGSHLVAQMDRSDSFRESMDPMLSSLPSMTRNSCVVAQGDVVRFFQCLRFDPKVVAAEHKSSRQGDFRRHINVALGISADDSSSGSLKGKSPPEDVKRVKAIIRESYVKARERAKTFNEALSVFNKCFPSIPSKKRSRSDSFCNDRSKALLSNDRSVLGPSLAKMGTQNPAVTNSCEFEPPKLEERKNAVPNKRTRTSLLEARSNALVRPSAALDRDREILNLANNGLVQGDDRNLSIGVEGWEKAKMKKKRSGIKLDISPIVVSTKSTDGYREAKQGMQQRTVTDIRSRLNSESHGFRPGVSNGTVGSGKSDGISQSTGLSMRSSVPRPDMDNSSLHSDKREPPIASDKERVNFRAVNKTNVRDDFNSASPTSSTKMHASIRAPRSGAGVTPKLSPVVHTVSNDWELSHCTNKPSALGANSRKRTASARSSSPPVAHWASQRPQKISRTARRTNLIPIVSNNDENPTLDSVSDISGNEIGLGFARPLSVTSPQQVKSKVDPLSSAALSESEESGPPEIKSKDKGKKSDELDEKAAQNVQKVSTMGLSSRKNKLLTGEDLGDGVRRQGRSGRGSTSTRSLTPMPVEKLGNGGTAKQLRSARLVSDKNEGKSGRPPTRKPSDRKAYSRQKHSTVNAAADFHVGSDDGQEQLLAAANAVINPAHALLSPFWRQMENYFGFISDVDIAYLKQQESDVGCAAETKSFELNPEQLVQAGRDVSLCQRLLAAIVPEEDDIHGNGDFEYNAHGPGFELDGELGSEGLIYPDNLQFTGHTAFNFHNTIWEPGHDEAGTDIMSFSNNGINSNFSHSVNGVLSDRALMASMASPEFPYDSMQMKEKLLLEVQSIGIFPEPMLDMQIEDDRICSEISKLEEKYSGQVLKKKAVLDKLMNSASEAKNLQEHEFEQRAYDKLTTMAYQKYMNCRSLSAAGGKGSSNKMAKQAALAFVKHTLEQCHKFEHTGKSCFSEPLFRDMFLSGLSQCSAARSADSNGDSELAKSYTNTSSHPLEASMGSQPCPRTSHSGQNGENYINSSDTLHPGNHLPEENFGKEDIWSNRVKKRELLLDDVVSAGTSSTPPVIGGSLSSSTKGKRRERDREGKGHNREVLPKNGTNKIGRPALSNVKGERKSKAKPKQKTQLSVSVNGLVGKIPDKPKSTLPSESKSSEMTTNRNAKEKDGHGLDVLDDHEAIDFSDLPGIDGLDGQGQDLASWLNIDDDGLPDHDDFMGLEIPMDDLSDLNMMV